MKKLHPKTQIGHVHLHVGDLERSLKFYIDVLGFELQQRMGLPGEENSAAFISAGDYHHHIGLNTWQGKGATPAPKGHAGLYHFAILYPDRKELARALKGLMDAKYPITGSADHGVSEAIYLNDPDGNGIELYRDRPKKEWQKNPDGSLAMISAPLDLKGLLKELE
jgi:catechol 2,3-dioxygenase